MNKERKKKINSALCMLSNAKDILEEVSSAESEAYDNFPEGLQNSERGEDMEDWIGVLEDSTDCIGVIINDLSERL